MKRSRAQSVTLSYTSIVVSVVITLLFTPFLVSSLGVEGYGLVSLAIAFLAYLNILDFGINDSLLRFFVKHLDDKDETQGFLSRMLTMYLAIGLLIMGSGLVFSQVFRILFVDTLTGDQIAEMSDMIVIMAFGSALFIGFNPVAALAYAHERHFMMKLLEIGTQVGVTLITVLLLLRGYGPFSVVMMSALGKIFQVLGRVIYVRRSIGVRIRLGKPHGPELKRVALYAAPIFVTVIAGVLFWRLDSILIGATIGTVPVAIYAIGVTFNKYFMSFATALSRVMTPEIIRRVDQGADGATLTDLMISISRIQAMFLLLILTALAVFGQRFLILWLGPEFAASYWVMLAILVPYTLEMTGNARNIILQVKGLYWLRSGITLAMALLNIPLTLYLLQLWGVLGAAISTGIAVFIGYILIAVLLKMRVGMEMGRYWLQTAQGIVPVAVVLSGLGLWAERYLPQGWNPLLLGGLGYTVIFGLAVYWLAARADERAFIDGILRRLRGKASKP